LSAEAPPAAVSIQVGLALVEEDILAWFDLAHHKSKQRQMADALCFLNQAG